MNNQKEVWQDATPFFKASRGPVPFAGVPSEGWSQPGRCCSQMGPVPFLAAFFVVNTCNWVLFWYKYLFLENIIYKPRLYRLNIVQIYFNYAHGF